MDPSDAFSASMFRWDPRTAVGFYGGPPLTSPQQQQQQQHQQQMQQVQQQQQQQAAPISGGGGVVGRLAVVRELDEIFQSYGVRYATVERIRDLGFTASTLVGMKDDEIDDMMGTLCHLFRWELLVGERYGIKAAVREERRRVDFTVDGRRNTGAAPASFFRGDSHYILDALSQEGLSEEPVQQDNEAAGSGGEVGGGGHKIKQKQRRGSSSKKSPTQQKPRKQKKVVVLEDDDEDIGDDEDDDGSKSGGCGGSSTGGGERQREHPFIVTEPGEVARGKKNGLDYLFHLFDQCREFLIQVQNQAKENGEKCPSKVTNQVFRYAKKSGASYINKPKMRHYVHCYALHCLDEEVSNELRRTFKERGENVGAWRLACYRPLVLIASHHAWDIDAVFAAHPRLAVWYVPTTLRQLCHHARSNAAVNVNATVSASGAAPPSSSVHHGGCAGNNGLPALF